MIDVFMTFRQNTMTSFFSIFIQEWFASKGIECVSRFDRFRYGNPPDSLEEAIKNSRNVLIIVTHNTWGREDDETCWMGREIEAALAHNKNIVLLFAKLSSDDSFCIQNLPLKFRPLTSFKFVTVELTHLLSLRSSNPDHPLKKNPKLERALNHLLASLDIDEINARSTSPYCGDKPYIFISYSHRDSDRVIPTIQKLIHSGYRVWYDDRIEVGSEWDKNIAEHILRCGYFIAFMSENYLTSSNCKDELYYARELEKDRFLIYLEETELPPEMQMRQSRIHNIFKYTFENEQCFFEKLLQAKHLSKYKK